MPGGVSFEDMNESQTVEWMVHSSSRLYVALYFMLHKCVGYDLSGWQFELWLELDRKYLDLEPDLKPGDIDILVVPTLGGDRFVERSFAVEVKKKFMKEGDLSKSPNSMGVAQVNGLLRDGFPFVGLLHVMIVEHTKKYDVQIGMFNGFNPQTGEMNPPAEFQPISIAPHIVQARHEPRIQSAETKDACGYKIQIYGYNSENPSFLMANLEESRSPSKNPNTSRTLLERLRILEVEPDFSIENIGGSVVFNEAPRRKRVRLGNPKILKGWRSLPDAGVAR